MIGEPAPPRVRGDGRRCSRWSRGGPVQAHGPDPVLSGSLFAPGPGPRVPLASGAEPPDGHQGRDQGRRRGHQRHPCLARPPRSSTTAAGRTSIGYGPGATCGVNGLACFTRDPPDGFTMWLREHGHVFDWGTLRWCQMSSSPPNGCYDAETIALDEFGHVEILDHHVNYGDDRDYTDAVVQTYLADEAEGRLERARLRPLRRRRRSSGSTTCPTLVRAVLDLPRRRHDARRSPPARPRSSTAARSTFTATLKVATGDGYGRLRATRYRAGRSSSSAARPAPRPGRRSRRWPPVRRRARTRRALTMHGRRRVPGGVHDPTSEGPAQRHRAPVATVRRRAPCRGAVPAGSAAMTPVTGRVVRALLVVAAAWSWSCVLAPVRIRRRRRSRPPGRDRDALRRAEPDGAQPRPRRSAAAAATAARSAARRRPALAAEGGDPVDRPARDATPGATAGSDSPWLPGAPLAVGAGEPLSMTLDAGAGVGVLAGAARCRRDRPIPRAPRPSARAPGRRRSRAPAPADGPSRSRSRSPSGRDRELCLAARRPLTAAAWPDARRRRSRAVVVAVRPADAAARPAGSGGRRPAGRRRRSRPGRPRAASRRRSSAG